jgi:hypothetical protein
MLGTVFDTATAALATACITDADNEIRKMLSKVYDFTAAPFLTTTTLPPMITTLSETLAIGYMYENMARGGGDAYVRSDKYLDRAMLNLNALLSGEVQLLGVSGAVVDVLDSNWKVHVTDDYSHTFNEDHPKTWEVSQDKLDDIEDERDE